MNLDTTAKTVQAECLGTRVRQAARVLSRIYDDALRPAGLHASQFSMLVGAARFGDRGATIGALAEKLVMDRTTLTRNIAPLEKEGYLRVARSPTDARLKIVLLTWGRAIRPARDRSRAFRSFQAVRTVATLADGMGSITFSIGVRRLSMFRQLVAVCLGLGATCVSSTVLAQSDSGFALGLRVGYAIPMGKLGALPTQAGGAADTSHDSVHDEIKGMIPIWLDVGYRIDPALYVGAFFQYGFGLVNKDNPNNSACNQGISCSAHDLAFGANLHYHLMPDAPFDPWLGLGLGYELLTASASGTETLLLPQSVTVDGSTTVKGFQFLVLEAGGDFKATPALAVGPFVNFALGEYTSWSSTVTANGASQDTSGNLQDTGLHEWLTLGVRGQYNL